MIALMHRLAVGGLFLATMATAAWAAPDPQRIADMLIAAAAASGEFTLSHDNATTDGESVVLANVRLTATGRDATAAVGSVVVTGAVEREAGGFTASRIAFSDGIVESPFGTFTWSAGSIDNAVVPSAEEVEARSRLRPFEILTFADLVVTEADTSDAIVVSSLSVELGELIDETPTRVLVSASGAALPASVVRNPIGAAMIDGMGYDGFQADVVLDGDYDPNGDTVTVRALTVDAIEVGRIAVAARFSGLSFRGLTDPEESAEARAAAKLDSMVVRFDDGGLVGRLLDMQANMLGGTRDEVRAQLVFGALPFALSFVDNETFRDQALAAASAFLEDPRSLTITLAPAAPVPLGQVMRTALRTPLQLPDLLAANVVAND